MSLSVGSLFRGAYRPRFTQSPPSLLLTLKPHVSRYILFHLHLFFRLEIYFFQCQVVIKSEKIKVKLIEAHVSRGTRGKITVVKWKRSCFFFLASQTALYHALLFLLRNTYAE